MGNNKKSTRKLILDYMVLIGKLEPKIFVSLLLATVFTSLLTIYMVYVPKNIINGLMGNWSTALFTRQILITAMIIILLRIASEVSVRRFEKDSSLLSHKINAHFSKKVLSLKYELLEDPEVLDLKMRASYPLEQGLLIQLLNDLKAAAINLFQIMGIGTILFGFSPWIFVFSLSMSIAGGYVMKKNNKVEEDFTNKLMPINRRYNYYLGALVDDMYQKEFRLYGLGDVVERNMKVYMYQTYEMLQTLHAATRNLQIINFSILAATRFVTYFYAGIRTIGMWGSKISLGEFSIIIISLEQFTSSVGALIDSAVSVSRTVRYFEPLLEFNNLAEYIDLEIDRNKKLVAPIETLEFRNVTFSYPKSDVVILDNISFTLRKGETLALVGRNNAGKSTIVKLIARLFEPTSGEILWNGEDIRNLSLESYLTELAYVFQDFRLFPLKIWENISCATANNPTPEISKKIDEVINRVDMDRAINNLPSGLNTYLNKFLHEDGTDFSGGESQKLAIARAIYKDASFAVLDEPTAALDPLAESEIYGNFSNLVKGKTALFISHRMSASRFCDRILVLDQGKIIGNGSHDELLQSNELYYSLYEAQAQYYKN